MKKQVLLAIIILIIGFSSKAQERIDPKGMNYVMMRKPNNIIYHDTLYSGRKQFEQLFYRTMDLQLIHLIEKHQSNKISGQILGIVGTIATIIGISKLGSLDGNKGAGWALVGGGFAVSLTGGYLTLMGQKNLNMAVTLFNQKYHQAALGIGVAGNNAGLVYKF